MSYAEYFKTILYKSYCTGEGELLKTKDVIAKDCFGLDFPVAYLSDFNNVLNPSGLYKNGFYQLKIINTMHYMISWIEIVKDKPELMIADTNNRGIGVLARTAKRINKEHFAWLLEI
jgi:hypothetical protein